jgi:hypothetical protein
VTLRANVGTRLVTGADWTGNSDRPISQRLSLVPSAKFAIPPANLDREITTRNLYGFALFLPGFKTHFVGSVYENDICRPDDRHGIGMDKCARGGSDHFCRDGSRDLHAGYAGRDREPADGRDGGEGGSADGGRGEPGFHRVGYGQLRGDQLGQLPGNGSVCAEVPWDAERRGGAGGCGQQHAGNGIRDRALGRARWR